MTEDHKSFSDRWPVAWTFHRNTSRWAYNATAAAEDAFPGPAKEYPSASLVGLPAPEVPDTSFKDALSGRFSCRRYADRPLPLKDLSTLLHVTYGVTDRSLFGNMEFLDRPVPSGGGLYPLEVYLLARNVQDLAPGIYHFAPLHHGLEQLRDVLVPRRLADYLFMGQRSLTDASAIVMLAAEVGRSLVKYGDRGYRYIILEAGHAAQNLNLACSALGLGSCNIGGFFDQDLADLLQIDTEVEVPVYGVAIGVPEEGNRESLRALDED